MSHSAVLSLARVTDSAGWRSDIDDAPARKPGHASSPRHSRPSNAKDRIAAMLARSASGWTGLRRRLRLSRTIAEGTLKTAGRREASQSSPTATVSSGKMSMRSTGASSS